MIVAGAAMVVFGGCIIWGWPFMLLVGGALLITIGFLQ